LFDSLQRWLDPVVLLLNLTWIKLPFSLDWYQHPGILVLHQEHDELGPFRGACVAADYMNVIGPFIKGLAWRERDFLAAFHLHHNGAFEHVNECVRIVAMNRIGSPEGYTTVIIKASLPGHSGRPFDMSGVTWASCANGTPAMRNASTIRNRDLFTMLCLRRNLCPVQTRLWGSFGSVDEPVFETRLSESRTLVRDQRSLAHLDAVVPPVRVGDHLAGIVQTR
jgi:hypothetical protein